METGGIARVWGRGLARVLRPLSRNRVEVEYAGGKREIVSAYRTTMVRRPNGDKPTRDKGKVLEEDARRQADPQRPTVNLNNPLAHEDDHNDHTPVPTEDPADEDQGDNHVYTPTRAEARDGWPPKGAQRRACGCRPAGSSTHSSPTTEADSVEAEGLLWRAGARLCAGGRIRSSALR